MAFFCFVYKNQTHNLNHDLCGWERHYIEVLGYEILRLVKNNSLVNLRNVDIFNVSEVFC